MKFHFFWAFSHFNIIGTVRRGKIMLDQAENLEEGLNRFFENLYQIILNTD